MELRRVRKPLLRFTRMCLRNSVYHQAHLVERRLDLHGAFSEPQFGVQTVASHIPYIPALPSKPTKHNTCEQTHQSFQIVCEQTHQSGDLV